MLVYYLHEHLDVAEALLLRCLEMGEPQLAELRARFDDPALSAEERSDLDTELYDLVEAVGDAYQNLGVLEWVHRRDGPRALAYLARSVEIGPDPRPDLTNSLMPLIRGEREPAEEEYYDFLRWGAGCDAGTSEAARE